MKNYNDRLKELRQDNDLTQKEVAAHLKIDQRVYSTYETGVRSLPIEHLIKLCKYYNVSADWVLGLKTYTTTGAVLPKKHKSSSAEFLISFKVFSEKHIDNALIIVLSLVFGISLYPVKQHVSFFCIKLSPHNYNITYYNVIQYKLCNCNTLYYKIFMGDKYGY